MKKLHILLLGLGVMCTLALLPVVVQAQGVWGACGSEAAANSSVCADATSGVEATSVVRRVVNLLLYAIGALSIIMIIFSGLKYVTSRGDPEQVKSAKNTLLYAVIGLIVSLLAFAIVAFVVATFDPAPPEVE